MKETIAEIRKLLAKLDEFDFGYPISGNKVRAPLDGGAAIAAEFLPAQDAIHFYSLCNGFSAPDVHNGYFIAGLERISKWQPGDPVSITDDKGTEWILVFGSDGGGGYFAFVPRTGEIEYLAWGSVTDSGEYSGEHRKVASNFTEFLEIILSDFRAFINGDFEHNYLV